MKNNREWLWDMKRWWLNATGMRLQAMSDGRSLTNAQKVEWEKTRVVFGQYAARADFSQFDALMARVPDVDPLPGDELL